MIIISQSLHLRHRRFLYSSLAEFTARRERQKRHGDFGSDLIRALLFEITGRFMPFSPLLGRSIVGFFIHYSSLTAARYAPRISTSRRCHALIPILDAHFAARWSRRRAIAVGCRCDARRLYFICQLSAPQARDKSRQRRYQGTAVG